ncbi:MAG: EutN/CcmL family microcompartment protein [Planctomycetaceae bacterium]|jgi:ethanolamine utilization protein EutN|nr:EutN/CcmL family microcompartment protein [Planctomycetaceae bacterium]
MLIAKIVGSLIATLKTESMLGQKLLLVEPFRVSEDRATMKTTGRSLVAVDTVGAGEGEYVLIVQGSSARATPETQPLPVDATIIGIVDAINIGQQQVTL